MSDLPVVFLHVMKCGGTSVRAGLATGLTGHRHGPDVFELDARAAMAAAGGTGTENWAFRDALLSYVVATQRPAVVVGHFRYRDRHAPLLDTTRVITVLREPIARLVSLYDYRRNRPGVVLPLTRSLEEQAVPRWPREGHRYVSTFCGRDDLDPRSDEAIAAAVANLRRFAVVGSVERMDAFAEQLSTLVAKPFTFPRLNTSPAPATTEISPVLLAQLRELCAPDLQLHEQLFGSSGSG